MKLKQFIKSITDGRYMRFYANDCDLCGCYAYNLRQDFKKHEILERKVIDVEAVLEESIFNSNTKYPVLTIVLGEKVRA